jgi:hypothetical protein
MDLEGRKCSDGYNLGGTPVNRTDAAVGIGLALVGGKIEGAVVKTIEKQLLLRLTKNMK